MKELSIKFYSPSEKLPEIPEGERLVSLLVVFYDNCYDEIKPGYGYDTYTAIYKRLDDEDYNNIPYYKESGMTEDFQVFYLDKEWGYYGPSYEEIYLWAYMPNMINGEFV